jgi:hypothetical protein
MTRRLSRSISLRLCKVRPLENAADPRDQTHAESWPN